MSVNVVYRSDLNPDGEDLKSEARALASEQKIPKLIAKILAARGILGEDASKFLSPTLREGLRDPYEIKNINCLLYTSDAADE